MGRQTCRADPQVRKPGHRDRLFFGASDAGRSTMAAACRLSFTLLFLLNVSVSTALASPPPRASISGTVLDPLGATVAQATVALVRDGQQAASAASGAHGEFTFD